jgi:hypothetical protein
MFRLIDCQVASEIPKDSSALISGLSKASLEDLYINS